MPPRPDRVRGDCIGIKVAHGAAHATNEASIAQLAAVTLKFIQDLV
jgi:hypothetical protein